MRKLTLDSISEDGITLGQVTFIAHSDGGLIIEVEEWKDDIDQFGDPYPSIFVATGHTTDEGADTLLEWMKGTVR